MLIVVCIDLTSTHADWPTAHLASSVSNQIQMTWWLDNYCFPIYTYTLFQKIIGDGFAEKKTYIIKYNSYFEIMQLLSALNPTREQIGLYAVSICHIVKVWPTQPFFVFAIWPKAVKEVAHFQECSGTFKEKVEWSLIQMKQGSADVFVC